MPVPQLIDGDDSQQSGITVEVWPVVVELKPSQDVRVSCVALKGGNLSWSNQCAPEDFIIEGLVDGAWRTLAEIKDAATRNKHDNTIPVECRFKPLKIAKLRITVTRSSDSGKRYLVLREIEGFLEDK